MIPVRDKVIVITIPGHGQQNHEDPDGQWGGLDDPKHCEQGECLPLLWTKRKCCGNFFLNKINN